MAQAVEERRELVVIGGGPGGYPAAFDAADKGMQVTLINAEQSLGGTCLHRGCIPSKALLHLAGLINETREAKEWGLSFGEPLIDLDRVREFKSGVVEKLTSGIDQLCQARGVTLVEGEGSFLNSETLQVSDSSGKIEQFKFQHAIVATGSSPARPSLFDIGDERVMDSTGALELSEVPGRLLVVGGGYIGLEMGSVYASLGSEVTVVEMTSTLLLGADRDLVGPLKKRLESQFSAIHLKTKVSSLKSDPNGIIAGLDGESVEPRQVFDAVLVCVGRIPNSENLGLENTQVDVDERGFIKTNHCQQTKDPGILAVGDVSGEPMLAHKATRQAKVAVGTLLGEQMSMGNAVIPAVVFTDPEIAWCGLTETEARSQSIMVKSSRFPWAASGRAQTLARTEGLTKIVFDPESEKVLGVGIVGPGAGAGELISEGVAAVERGITVREIAETIHAHPTLSETIMESAEAAIGQATHLFRRKR